MYRLWDSGVEKECINTLYTEKKNWVSERALGVVRVWQAGPNFKCTLELKFKQQIPMIFIVEYFFSKGILKMREIIRKDNPFKI